MSHPTARLFIAAIALSACGPTTESNDAVATEDETSSGPSEEEIGACASWCATVAPCEGTSVADCEAECAALRRFHTDHYAPACLVAVETALACEADLTCEEYAAHACQQVEIMALMTCEANVDAGPELAALCEAAVACGVTQHDCELSLLDTFMREAYVQGCETEYTALLACTATIPCSAPESELETTCAAEISALDATGCEIFG